MSPHIRPYGADDLDALYEICLRTGAAGGDATALVDDPLLFGHLYAAPYGVLEPEHALVVDDGAGRAVGYVVGALDTVAFESRCEELWWPALRDRYPVRPEGTSLDDLLIELLHHRTPSDEGLLATHPSHLHIDLLPEVQGLGFGRRLLDSVFEVLRRDGSPGVHWGVSTLNQRAIAFYRHVGSVEVGDDGMIVTFGVRL